MACAEALVGDAIKQSMLDNGMGVWADIVRTYLPLYKLTELGDPSGNPHIKIAITPAGTDIQRIARTLHSFDVACHIGLIRRVSATDITTGGDAVMEGAEAVEELLRDKQGNPAPLPSLPAAMPMAVERTLIYDASLLKDMNVFMAIVTARYRLTR
jgi:hypothetical protein